MKRILVAVDGSEPALQAVKKASMLACAMGGDLTIANVQIPLASFAKDWDGEGDEALERDERQWAELVVNLAAEEARRAGAKVSTVILVGSPAEAIAEYAGAHDFDLVVLGSRGRGAVSRALLGSVSSRALHLSKNPILIVP